MRYVGNLSESYAAQYADKQYTHSTQHHGKEVRWYDCWSHSDETRPTFGDSLNIQKTRQVDRIIRENPPNDVQVAYRIFDTIRQYEAAQMSPQWRHRK